jgi:hypothetical protein
MSRQGTQNGIAHIGRTAAYVGDGQIVGEVAWADDLDAIIENEDPYGSRDEIIAVDQCISNQFFQSYSGNLQFAEAVNTPPTHLFPPQMAKNKIHCPIKLGIDSPDYIGTFDEVGGVDVRTGIRNGFDDKRWEKGRCPFGKDQNSRYSQPVISEQTHVG